MTMTITIIAAIKIDRSVQFIARGAALVWGLLVGVDVGGAVEVGVGVGSGV